LVSLLSHATSNSKPAASIIIFKRFKQHSISAQACPQSYISVGPFLLDAFLLDASSLLDGSGRHRAASGSPDHRNKGQIHSPMNALKRPAKPVELKVTLGKAPAELPFDFGNSGGFGDLQPLSPPYPSQIGVGFRDIAALCLYPQPTPPCLPPM
jgi:hypothetical protein